MAGTGNVRGGAAKNGKWRRMTRCLIGGLVLLGLTGCGAIGDTGGDGSGGSSGPPAPLVLNQAYSEGGITVTVTRYQAPVDPASAPISPDNRVPNVHVVYIACTLTNTTGQALGVETRLQSTSAGGGGIGKFVDLAPDAINGQDVVGRSASDLDALEVLPAGKTAQRTVYFQVDPDLTTMAFYLNTWTPTSHGNSNLPPLFLIRIPS